MAVPEAQTVWRGFHYVGQQLAQHGWPFKVVNQTPVEALAFLSTAKLQAQEHRRNMDLQSGPKPHMVRQSYKYMVSTYGLMLCLNKVSFVQ